MSSSLRTAAMPLYPIEKGPYTVEAPGVTAAPGETVPRRHIKAKNGLLERPAPEVATVYDLLVRSKDKYPDSTAVGSRKLVKEHKEVKKVPKNVDGEIQQVDKEWTFFELSSYTFLTYTEYFKLVQQIGAGYRALGLTKEDKVHLFATTTSHWLAISHGCATQSMSIVTAYDTLGAKGVEHTMVQSKPTAIYLDPHLLKTASAALKNAPTIKYVFYDDASNQPVPASEIDKFKASHPELKVLSFEELRKLGEDNPVDPVPPKAEDTFCIMYTSGSTGPPKGCPVSHAQFIAGVAGLHAVVEEVISHNERILAYLPLAHILEFILENLVLFIGGTIGYGSFRTLSDTSMRNSAGDMREFGPTVMVGVPQVWETVKKGIMDKVSKSGALVQKLFWGAYAVKGFLVRNNMPLQGAFDSAIFGKVRQSTGGRLRFVFNGASGISDDTRHFISLVAAPMITGYGLTETCGCGALGSPLQYTNTAIGPMPASIEVKLVSLPELNYHAESDGSKPPQGEIYLRGGPVMRAYFENEEETRKTITPDGWFKTGDIGEFEDGTGHLKVIDRTKNLIKMQGGEYIALEKLEAVYRSAPQVQNIMVYGGPTSPKPVAVVFPNEKALKETADKLGVDEHHMYKDSKVRGQVLKDLLAVGRNSGLAGIELVSAVLLCEEEWTLANNLVTATQKVNRRALQEKYKKDIEEIIKSG